MKKLLSLIALLTVLTLTACGGNKSSFSTSDVIQSFKDVGLEISEVFDLPNKEFGDTREEGKRILVPALGEDAGGRLFKIGLAYVTCKILIYSSRHKVLPKHPTDFPHPIEALLIAPLLRISPALHCSPPVIVALYLFDCFHSKR